MKAQLIILLGVLFFSAFSSYALCTWSTQTNCFEDNSCHIRGNSFCRNLGCHAEKTHNGKVVIVSGNDIVNVGSYDISKTLPENCAKAAGH